MASASPPCRLMWAEPHCASAPLCGVGTTVALPHQSLGLRTASTFGDAVVPGAELSLVVVNTGSWKNHHP